MQQKYNHQEIKDETYRHLVDAVMDYAIFVMDKDGNILTWNKGAERLKGYKASEIIGKNFKIFYTQEDLIIHHPEHVLEVAGREGRYEEEGWRVRKDGEHFWANILVTRLDDGKGNFIGFAKITRDLTEKRITEENLRRSEERFRTLISNVQDYAIISLDVNGLVTSWNTGAEKIKGYKAEEILGKHFSLFYTEEARAAGMPEKELAECLIAGRYEDEGWRIRKDGTRFWANVVVTLQKNGEGQVIGFSKITRDLTERMQTEEVLRESNASLEQKVSDRTAELVQALKTKDKFISIASHELNTPLTTLKMQSQLRLKKIKSSSETFSNDTLEKYFSDDLRQIKRLTTIVDDILEVSRFNTGKFSLKKAPVDLVLLTKEAVNQFAPQFERNGVGTEIIYPEKKIEGNWDAFRLEQVLNNLLSNALKYGKGKPVSVIIGEEKNHAIIKITDKGIGISEKDTERIFGQFERAISATEISGLGLGLYISKQIVEAHNGKIRVESELNKGSTFIVELPLGN